MLINRRTVKEFALEMAKHRAHKFTRGGSDFFVKCEGNLKEFICNSVHRVGAGDEETGGRAEDQGNGNQDRGPNEDGGSAQYGAAQESV